MSEVKYIKSLNTIIIQKLWLVRSKSIQFGGMLGIWPVGGENKNEYLSITSQEHLLQKPKEIVKKRKQLPFGDLIWNRKLFYDLTPPLQSNHFVIPFTAFTDKDEKDLKN